MDVAALTAFLAPLLPKLLGAGGRVADAVIDKVGQDAAAYAERLWDRLRGRVEERESAREAATDVAHAPDDEDLRTVLKVQLQKILAEDEELTRDVSRLWDEARTSGAVSRVSTAIASGPGSVAIGGDASGNTITTSAAVDGTAQPGSR